MLLKVYYKKTITCWFKNNFCETEINNIDKLIKSKLENVVFNPYIEGYYCKTKKQYNTIINTIGTYFKMSN